MLLGLLTRFDISYRPNVGYNLAVPFRTPLELTTVERIWHVEDSQGQILALAFRQNFLKRFDFFSSLLGNGPLLLLALQEGDGDYRGTSLIRNSPSLASFRRKFQVSFPFARSFLPLRSRFSPLRSEAAGSRAPDHHKRRSAPRPFTPRAL